MTRLKLREYDPQASRLAQFVLLRERTGEQVIHSVPAPGAVLMRFSDAKGFAVLVDLREWCDERHPMLARLATDQLSHDDIRNWFHYSQESCELMMPSGSVTLLKNSQPETLIPEMLLPEVNTSLGRGWLLSAAESMPSQEGFNPAHLSFSLNLVLGESFLRQRHVRRLECGDVLIISQFVEEVRCEGHRLGSYQLEEDVFMFNDFADENLEADESELTRSGDDSRQGLQNMPVRLEFVVHEKTVTLGELQQLSAGAVIGVPAHGKDSISIRANGALIGRGELIWIEDKLCVEVQSLFSGHPDGK